MAPEARKGKPVPFISDMYSIGIILHYMMAKEEPSFTEDSVTLNIPKQYS